MSARLDDLTAMRELLWESVRQADPEKRAPLFARLESVVAQIEALVPAASKGDAVDQLAARRSTRGAGTAKSRRRPTADQG